MPGSLPSLLSQSHWVLLRHPHGLWVFQVWSFGAASLGYEMSFVPFAESPLPSAPPIPLGPCPLYVHPGSTALLQILLQSSLAPQLAAYVLTTFLPILWHCHFCQHPPVLSLVPSSAVPPSLSMCSPG